MDYPTGGYMKLYRRIKHNFLWPKGRAYTRLEAWEDMLFRAEYMDTKVQVKGRLILVKRGEFICFERKLADDWKWSRERIRRFLKLLESENMIKITACTRSETRITIVNYDFYQGGDTSNETNARPETVPEIILETRPEKELSELENQTSAIPETRPETVPETRPDLISKRNKERNIYTAEFENFWKEYPNKKGKDGAFRCWKTRLKEGYKAEQMILAAKNYAIEQKDNNPKFIKHGPTFLGPDKPFLDYLSVSDNQAPENKPVTISNDDIDIDAQQRLKNAEEYWQYAGLNKRGDDLNDQH
ncbi:MAG TPA: hypothetical protein DDW50_21060 [Firmicutes bacterium]|jgi:hypothetical protein|nr:hypothetical protein [Bacillota bacterium]